ncbi:competence type IV pilus minor pilin ComGE [Streptococcus dentapri]|uniref:Competence type IV pilus minor pilin ComGE n=1 Tax=Streptococcus dentapri TaxID=573564 RepID=A0ABV8D2M7_9STRE
MVAIKKQKIKAYILLESLIALAILAMIVSLVLSEINRSRQDLVDNLHDQEVLNVAQMAIQTNQRSLTLNGVTVRVEASQSNISIYEGSEEILHVVKR